MSASAYTQIQALPFTSDFNRELFDDAGQGARFMHFSVDDDNQELVAAVESIAKGTNRPFVHFDAATSTPSEMESFLKNIEDPETILVVSNNERRDSDGFYVTRLGDPLNGVIDATSVALNVIIGYRK